MNRRSDDLYVDVGVLANLCVADAAAQILAALPYRCMLLSGMQDMRYPIDDGGTNAGDPDSDEEGKVRHVEVRTLVDKGALHMCPAWDTDHMKLVVELSDRFSDRAAHLVAWAVLQGGMIGSDDQRTRRLTEEFFPEIRLLTTPQLIQLWQLTTGLSDDEASVVIRQIRHRAFFTPTTSDPLRAWWQSHQDDR